MNQQIKNNLSVTRNTAIAGNLTVGGRATLQGSLRVEGWLEAPNVKSECKGLFPDAESLAEAYPHPRPGWWALVGNTIPAEIYQASAHGWVGTSQMGGAISVDLNYYDNAIDRISDDVAELSHSVANITHPVETKVIDDADLVLADEDENPIATFSGGHIRTANFDSETLDIEHPLESVDIDDADLVLADEDENPIATFSGGHIRTANFDSETLDIEHPLESMEIDDADLVLADEDENPIATFSGGHIRTANFDSSNINASGSIGHSLKGKYLSIVGDSISTYRGFQPDGYTAFYPSGDITSVDRTWWAQVVKYSGMRLLKNCSWSGSRVCGDTSSSAYVACSDSRIADLADGDLKPDVVIVLIGTNDIGSGRAYLGDWNDKSSVPASSEVSTFSEAYALMVIKIQQAYPEAQVYCCTLLEFASDTYPYLSPRGLSLSDFNRCIRSICEVTGAHLIDLHSCGINHWNVAQYLADGTHPNAAGASLMCQCVLHALNSSIAP